MKSVLPFSKVTQGQVLIQSLRQILTAHNLAQLALQFFQVTVAKLFNDQGDLVGNPDGGVPSNNQLCLNETGQSRHVVFEIRHWPSHGGYPQVLPPMLL